MVNYNWKGPLPPEAKEQKSQYCWTIENNRVQYKPIWHSPVDYKGEKPKEVQYVHFHDGHLWTNCDWKGPMPAMLKEKRTDNEITKYIADGSIWKTNVITPPLGSSKTNPNRKTLDVISEGGGYHTRYMSDGGIIQERG